MKIQYSLVLLLTIFSYANGISVTTGWNKFDRNEVIFKDPDDNAILDDSVLQCSNLGLITDAEGKTVSWECAAGYAHSWQSGDDLPYQCNPYSLAGEMFLKMNGKECMKQGLVFPTISNNDVNLRITSKAQCEDLKEDICAAYNAANELDITICGSVSDQTSTIQYMGHLPQGCTLVVNTVGSGSYSFQWTDQPGSNPTDTANKYAINIATDCNAPSSTTGYNVSGLTATFASWDSSSVTCASGYGGTASIVKCSAAGQAYSLSGCFNYNDNYQNTHDSSWKLIDPNGQEPDDSQNIYCNTDGKMVQSDGTEYITLCETGYKSADWFEYYNINVGDMVSPATGYTCDPSTGQLVVGSSGTCLVAGCTDPAASNYNSSAIFRDVVYGDSGDDNSTTYDKCEYDETDKCAQYQSNKISGVCLRQNAGSLLQTKTRPELVVYNVENNIPASIKTSDCSATTCSPVSPVTVSTSLGVKINGDNNAYCVSGALVTDTVATASQACDTANYYFKDGDSANSDGSISGYTCSGTTVSEPPPAGKTLSSVSISAGVDIVGQFSYDSAVSSSTVSAWLPNSWTGGDDYASTNYFDDGTQGTCNNCQSDYGTDDGLCLAFYKEIKAVETAQIAAGKSNAEIATALEEKLHDTLGVTGLFDVGSSIQPEVSYSYMHQTGMPKGCIIRHNQQQSDHAHKIRIITNGESNSNSLCDADNYGTYTCVKFMSPSKCEAVNAVSGDWVDATTLDGTQTCESGSTSFVSVTCATNYKTGSDQTTSSGYSCSSSGVVSSTDPCLAKCSDTAVAGYTGAPNNLFKDTFDGSGVSCATDYHVDGTISVTACSGAGAQPSYSGCAPDTCTSTLPTGYAFASSSQRVLTKADFDVTIECASTHLQMSALTATCDADGQDLTVSGCLPKATIDSAVATGTTLKYSGIDITNNAKLVCDAAGNVKYRTGSVQTELISNEVTAECKTNYYSANVAIQCDANNNIVNSGTLCSAKCNEPGSDVVYDVADGNANTDTVSFNLCHDNDGTTGSATKVNNQYLPAGCFKDGGTFKFNEYEDSNGNPSGAPCNSAYKCKQYATVGYRYGSATSTVAGSESVNDLDCAAGYSGNAQATCPGPNQDLVFSGCTKLQECLVSSNALAGDCMCGESQCSAGQYCDIDGCSDNKACPSNFYTAVAAGDLSSSGSGNEIRTSGAGDLSLTEEECTALGDEAGSTFIQVVPEASKDYEPVGCGLWIDTNDNNKKYYRYNPHADGTKPCSAYTSCVSKIQDKCNCGEDKLVEGEFCALNSDGNREKAANAPCSAGAGANSAACFCPTSASNPRLGAGSECTPSGGNDVYCYDTDNDGTMECSTSSLNKPDDFMLEDPGEVSTTDLDVWLVSHASCGAGKFNNLKRSSILGFDCIACDRTAFLNNYNAPYGVKATNVDGKDTLQREQTMDNNKGVVHGRCCINPHHSVCAEMIKEYKSKCELSLVMDNNGNIVDEVSKGTGVQCLDSTDVDGNYDCVMGPNNAVCQNGGTPTGKIKGLNGLSTDGCTCDCSKVAPWTGTHCQTNSSATAALAAACANDVAITSTCSCHGADRTEGSCDTNGYNPKCVEGGLLKDMTEDTCVCIDTVGNSISVVYKSAYNSESTATCTNGNVA